MRTYKKVASIIPPILTALSVSIIVVLAYAVYAVYMGGKWSTPSFTYYTAPRYASAIASARSNWNCNTVFNMYEVSPLAAQVGISSANYGHTNWAGNTYLYPNPYGGIYQAGHIYLNEYYLDYYVNQRMVIIAHEMGHIIGLGDLPPWQYCAVMTGSLDALISCGVTGVTQDDINHTNNLYR
ncbi:MAG: hypothetical protein J7M17_08930 [Anaerolineae bacterium]|nr:hypothetical protein [Anaerolineae bacterium]